MVSKKVKEEILEEKVCIPIECSHADFAKDAYCPVNIGLYCKKYKQIVQKYATCLDYK